MPVVHNEASSSKKSSSSSHSSTTSGVGRILVDCGEGTQRACLEYNQRLSTLRAVCLTSLQVTSTGGLPGLLLTAADVQAAVSSAATSVSKNKTTANPKTDNDHNNSNNKTLPYSRSTTMEVSSSSSSSPIKETGIVSRKDQSPIRDSKDKKMRPGSISWPFLVFSDDKNNKTDSKSSPGDASSSSTTALQIVGPPQTKTYLAALRHFVRRPHFPVQVHEQAPVQDDDTTRVSSSSGRTLLTAEEPSSVTTVPAATDSHTHYMEDPAAASPPSKRAKPTPSSQTTRTAPPPQPVVQSYYSIYPMTFCEETNATPSPAPNATSSFSSFSTRTTTCWVSYLFVTDPLPGKFRPDRAQALGVPRGPLFAQLKAGQSVTFSVQDDPQPFTKQKQHKKKQKAKQNKKNDSAAASLNATDTVHPSSSSDMNHQKTVHSWQVVEPSLPGVGVLVLRYPRQVQELPRFWNHVQQQLLQPHGLVSCSSSSSSSSAVASNHGTKNQDAATGIGTRLELVVHIASKTVLDDSTSVAWRRQSNHTVRTGETPPDHVWINMDPSYSITGTTTTPATTNHHHDPGTPHVSAAQTAQLRSLVCPHLYPYPRRRRRATPVPKRLETDQDENDNLDDNTDGVVVGYPSLEYQLIPRAKRGFVHSPHRNDNPEGENEEDDTVTKELKTLATDSGAVSLAKDILSRVTTTTTSATTVEGIPHYMEPSDSVSTNTNDDQKLYGVKAVLEPTTYEQESGQIIFTGTASAVPCKHRNVSGICLMSQAKRSKDNKPSSSLSSTRRSMMLLDVGEGTIGQLLLTLDAHSDSICTTQQQVHSILSQIKAVWISHPHADHHLGLLRLLHERMDLHNDNNTQDVTMERVLVIAPKPIFDFLQEYSAIHPWITQTYHGLDCREFLPQTPDANNNRSHHLLTNHNKNARAAQELLFQYTGISQCQSIPVQHCPNAYAVVLDGTSFGRLVYSGDCRPSRALALAGQGANVLIHEATFEDGMEAEACLKRHCTIGEALRVAKQMKAQTVILTHFSQRYPKIPPLPSDDHYNDANDAAPVIFAFDFMTLRPCDLYLASHLTPALRLLYPDENNGTKGNGAAKDSTEDATDALSEMAMTAMSQPGLFAQSELL